MTHGQTYSTFHTLELMEGKTAIMCVILYMRCDISASFQCLFSSYSLCVICVVSVWICLCICIGAKWLPDYLPLLLSSVFFFHAIIHYVVFHHQRIFIPWFFFFFPSSLIASRHLQNKDEICVEFIKEYIVDCKNINLQLPLLQTPFSFLVSH